MKYIALDEAAYSINANAKQKGFWDENNGVNFYLKQIAMIHSEATEILEAIRKQKGERAIVEEMADLIIRTLDLFAGMTLDGELSSSLEEVLEEKMRFNTTRPKMHGVLA